MNQFLKLIQIDTSAFTPKYLQIVHSILNGIASGQIEKHDLLPGFNEFGKSVDLPPQVIEQAYGELMKMGVISVAAQNKYLVATGNFQPPLRVLLLFNKLSAHKKIIFDAFAARLGGYASIDLHIYHNNFSRFKNLLNWKMDDYSKIAIIPPFIENRELSCEVINRVPKDKLVLIDKLEPGVTGQFGAVYEDFEQDIFQALKELLPAFNRYEKLKIIFPEDMFYSEEIVKGFILFCGEFAFDYDIIHSMANFYPEKKDVYICLTDEDLVALIEAALRLGLKAGQDIGIISYNETPLKKVILDGITTISTDFRQLGRIAADLVLNNSVEHIAVPFRVTMRNSI